MAKPEEPKQPAKQPQETKQRQQPAQSPSKTPPQGIQKTGSGPKPGRAFDHAPEPAHRSEEPKAPELPPDRILKKGGA